MSCIVRKYGGACFADRDGLLRVARQVLAGGELPVVIVVSARQGVTDQLSGQAQELAPTPRTRPGTCSWPQENYKVRLCWPRRWRSWAEGRKSFRPGRFSRRPPSSAMLPLKRSRSNECSAVWGAASCRLCPVSSAAPATGESPRSGAAVRTTRPWPWAWRCTRHGSNSARPRSMAFTTPTRTRTVTPAASTA